MTQSVNVGSGVTSLTVEQDNILKTATVLANAGELAVGIIGDISGSDISNTINGVVASNEVIQQLLFQRIAKRVTERKAA